MSPSDIFFIAAAALFVFAGGLFLGFRLGRSFGYEEAELDRELDLLRGQDHEDSRWALTPKGEALTRKPSV